MLQALNAWLEADGAPGARLLEGADLDRLGAAHGLAWLGPVVVAVLLAWVGYNGYQFTGSNTFCGKVCHGVMEPEYTAYVNSPHARVPCVDCHVGEGAEAAFDAE